VCCVRCNLEAGCTWTLKGSHRLANRPVCACRLGVYASELGNRCVCAAPPGRREGQTAGLLKLGRTQRSRLSDSRQFFRVVHKPLSSKRANTGSPDNSGIARRHNQGRLAGKKTGIQLRLNLKRLSACLNCLGNGAVAVGEGCGLRLDKRRVIRSGKSRLLYLVKTDKRTAK